jgi:hypothetical protein
MYVGGLLLLAGFGLFQQSKAILLFCPLWLLSTPFVTLYEEPVLTEKFGTSYLGYCRAVLAGFQSGDSKLPRHQDATRHSLKGRQASASARKDGVRVDKCFLY